MALADVDQDKLERYSRRFDVNNTYLDYKKMLATERPEILSICTWNSTHYEIVEEAVKNGVTAIFCEKPISDTIANAKNMVKLCQENNIIDQAWAQRSEL